MTAMQLMESGRRRVKAKALKAFGKLNALGIRTLTMDVIAGVAFTLTVVAPEHLATTILLTVSAFAPLIGIHPLAPGLLARGVASRLLTIAGAFVQFSTIHEQQALMATALVLVGVTTCAERLVKPLTERIVPYAANLPGAQTGSEPSFPYAVSTDLAVGATVLMALGAHHLTWLLPAALVLSAGAALMLLLVTRDAFARIRRRADFEDALPDHLVRLAPTFLLHWHAPAGTTYQVSMWLPYLERLGLPFVIIVRSEENFRELQATTNHPLLLRVNLEDLDAVIVPSVRAALYVNNAIRNAHLVRYEALKHIQLNHGESDKAPSYNPAFRMYDLNFVAGQAAIDRFADHGIDTRDGMFRIVGRPQVEAIAPARASVASDASPNRTVLYAPTWAGFYDDSNYSSLPAGPEIVRQLIGADCTVVFRPHPFTRRSPALMRARAEVIRLLEADRTLSGRPHVFGRQAEVDLSIVDCFNRSDAMISDVSSVVGDYLYSQKPFAMVAPGRDAATFQSTYPMARASYVVARDGSHVTNLAAVLGDMFGPDPLADTRRTLSTYYLGDIPREQYAQRFVEIARREITGSS